ncbi:hypothetical protein [Paenarthrobacter sp. PH39-S1]|uniref:hypothetical protein n=1 Tax=Paenarthrobacter sp. PH39-S1 TaxID=3046204 RepID=UPI0024BBAF26|nr:hypothetical protein [Paenarthrobacter sp. PH39-S1]MDJ0358458.1 hypothetical protein [Paenarthrobacter sp. PH39-S1]
MSARREITKQSAAEYARATKKGKGQILDELVAVTGWSRANARRALSTALKRKTPVRKTKRKPRRRTYGYDTLTALIRVWRLAGMPSGKYLASTMGLWLPKLEAYGELKSVRFSPEVRDLLMAVSGATIDRLLRPTREGMAPKGLSTTKAGSELRSSIAVRRAGQEHEQVPGFIEADLVAHCGPALVGEFARTLTATDVFTGWTENVTIRNSAYKWILGAMETVAGRLLFTMVGLDVDYAEENAKPRDRAVGHVLRGIGILSSAQDPRLRQTSDALSAGHRRRRPLAREVSRTRSTVQRDQPGRSHPRNHRHPTPTHQPRRRKDPAMRQSPARAKIREARTSVSRAS